MTSPIYSEREQSILDNQKAQRTLTRIAGALGVAAKALAQAQEGVAKREAEAFTKAHNIEDTSGLQCEFWPICDAYNALGRLLQSSADANGCRCLPGDRSHICEWCDSFADSVAIEGGQKGKINRWRRLYRGGDLNPI